MPHSRVWDNLQYRIAGIFRGRKLSRISSKGAFCGENFRGMLKLHGHIMGVVRLKFRGENFRRWLKNHEIRESFLPRKFPTIRRITRLLFHVRFRGLGHETSLAEYSFSEAGKHHQIYGPLHFAYIYLQQLMYHVKN